MNFSALIYQIARHTVIDFYRKKSSHDITVDQEFISDIESKKNLQDEIDNKLQIEKIENLLWHMKDEYREVILLKFIEELSIEEISKILNKTKGNIRVMIHRAINALKELSEKNNKSNGRHN